MRNATDARSLFAASAYDVHGGGISRAAGTNISTTRSSASSIGWAGESAISFPRRSPSPRMRTWDNYFWWLELGNFPANSRRRPDRLAAAARGFQPVRIEASIKGNTINVKTGAEKSPSGSVPNWSISASRCGSRQGAAAATDEPRARPTWRRCWTTCARAAIGNIRSGSRLTVAPRSPATRNGPARPKPAAETVSE